MIVTTVLMLTLLMSDGSIEVSSRRFDDMEACKANAEASIAIAKKSMDVADAKVICAKVPLDPNAKGRPA